MQNSALGFPGSLSESPIMNFQHSGDWNMWEVGKGRSYSVRCEQLKKRHLWMCSTDDPFDMFLSEGKKGKA